MTKPQVKTALELLNKNKQLTMNELAFDIKQKYPTFDITPQHLGQVIRDNNKTRKRTTKIKIYTLCEGQTFLIFSGVCPILNLQGCKCLLQNICLLG